MQADQLLSLVYLGLIAFAVAIALLVWAGRNTKNR